MKVKILLYYVFLFLSFIALTALFFSSNKLIACLFVFLCFFCKFYPVSDKTAANLFLDTLSFAGFMFVLTFFVSAIYALQFYEYDETLANSVFKSLIMINAFAIAAFFINEYKILQLKKFFKILILIIASSILFALGWIFASFATIGLFL